MRIGLNMQGLERVRKQLDRLSGPQFREATAKAINDTGFELRRKMQEEFSRVFDRPTPYVVKSVYLQSAFANATADRLVATVEPTYYGGKGIDPQQILRAQEAGGSRRDKRSEVLLRRAGILPAGYQTALPKVPFPGSEDGFGNIKGSFMVQLLAYFQTFGEQGFKANMSDRTKRGLLNGTARQKRQGPFIGRRYVVSYGKLRAGARTTRKGEADQRAQNLAPGIWAIVGTTGATVRPVLMFVKTPRYTPRLSMQRIAQAADTDNYLARRMRYRIRQAVGE